jgi:hypothetical protein
MEGNACKQGISQVVRDQSGHAKSRRSFTLILATKPACLQDVFSGSDGTRTRDLRRDSRRGLPWALGGLRWSLVARLLRFLPCRRSPLVATAAFHERSRTAARRAAVCGRISFGSDGTRPPTSAVTVPAPPNPRRCSLVAVDRVVRRVRDFGLATVRRLLPPLRYATVPPRRAPECGVTRCEGLAEHRMEARLLGDRLDASD